MSRMRRTIEQPLSLFSFQDIITSVTGVMVLLTLLLAVELIQRVVASPPQQTKSQIKASSQSIEEMQAEVDSLIRELQASGSGAEGLPSFDAKKLREERLELQGANERLQRENVQLEDRLSAKEREVAASETTSASERVKSTEELASLEQQIVAAREQLKSITTSNRIFFRNEQGGKETWIVEVTAALIQTAKIGVAAKPLQFADIAAFKSWLMSIDPATTAIYVVVKPGGESQFENCGEAIRGAGIELGFHVVPTERQVVDPVSGAATP